MFKNFIITSLRYLGKNFLFVGINILGLAVALALCITAYLNNKYDMNWDKTHENYEDIYKINITREIQDRQQEYGITPFALAPLLKQDLSGVEEITRYRNSYSPVKYGEKIFSKRIGYADTNFGEVFSLNIIKGDKNALKEKGNILISKRIANIYFGDEDPIGKVISVVDDKNKETTFTIAGIFKDLPLNSSFRYELLTQLENFENMWEIDVQKWDSWVAATFLLIRNHENIPEINEQLKKYIAIQNDVREDWIITSYFTKHLKEIADDREVWATWLRTSFHPAAVATPPIMAIFILIIAAFNFMNSSISFAGKRLKEIGLRKVFGGLRKHIVIQFISENLVISFIAIVLGVFISGFLVPEYSSMWEYMEIELNFTNDPTLIGFILILWLFTALLAGAYPAFYISKFNPIKIFKDNLKLKNKNLLSRFLLGFQYFTSVMALVMGVVFAQNAVFQEKIDLGYDKENLIILSMHNNNDYKPFEQVVKSNPKIEMYAGTNYHIGYGNYNRSIKYLDQQIETNLMHIGYDYLPTMKVKIMEGRGFNLENQSGDFAENNIIVNEKFVNDFGFAEPIGKTVYMNDTLALQIVGVSNDVYLYGAWSPVEPLIYRLDQEEEFGRIVIRTSPQYLTEVNDFLRAEWAELVPNYPYEGEYQEELLAEAKEVNKNIKVMFTFLAVCALFLSAIGLYTLVSLSVLNRTKEVGIRKVHGATVQQIMLIVTKPFSLLIIISTILGSVAGYYMSMMLMGSVFAIHMDPNVVSFAIPVLVIFLTSIITIVWRVYKAALQNPANSLRYE
ncbi:MAG: ABC transporter permease [Bacteroidales bacterium]|jgi:putative ABC transport system permease protein|nr:ABC transporter permease [Bacteroidales bacterium]